MERNRSLCQGRSILLITLLTTSPIFTYSQDQTLYYAWPWITINHKAKDSVFSFSHHIQARFNQPVPQFISLSNFIHVQIGHKGFGATGNYNFSMLPRSGRDPGWFQLFQMRFEHISGNKINRWLKRITFDYLKIVEYEQYVPDNKRVRILVGLNRNLSDKLSMNINNDIFIFNSKKYFSENRFQAGLTRQIKKNSLSMMYFNRWVEKGLVYKTNIIEHNIVIQYSICI